MSTMDEPGSIQERTARLTEQLLDGRNEQGFWEGRLSPSALGVAVSVIAFHFYDAEDLHLPIARALHWLTECQNPDGGYGDSPESVSNVSTSLLSYAALHVTHDRFPGNAPALTALSAYLFNAGIEINSDRIARHVLEFYHQDYTFSVPILVTCALCGIPGSDAFKPIPRLPFELALLPRNLYRFLNLNVVSYAIPALVAVGIAIFRHKRSGILVKAIRERSIPGALTLLEKIMPPSGGFLEAIPLTAFVALSLVKSGYRDHAVVTRAISFLRQTQRADGSFPIDVDLSTWVTTLAVKSFRSSIHAALDEASRQALTHHLLSVQNRTSHPFNGSPPGGWSWTHHSGSVSDGDDTPGAILALLALNPELSDQVARSVTAACEWMIRLQNGNGGFPAFSRGWGKLPFDQSSADLTGHAVVALAKALERIDRNLSPGVQRRYLASVRKAIGYLEKAQKDDGTWLPLWFGNQMHMCHHNPVYGTARVTAYLADAVKCRWMPASWKDRLHSMIDKGQTYLMAAQDPGGSWGGDKGLPGTIEETSLAVSALAGNPGAEQQLKTGLRWLNEQKIPLKAAPIGLYFASLWYYEDLYPLVMYLEALARGTEYLEKFNDTPGKEKL